MEGQIDLTKDSDDERESNARESTVESDAALARRLSAELNGEAPAAQNNNKRTIDLTADSQEEPPPRPAQRARTSQEYSTRAPAKPEQRLSIGAMRAAITQAGLATADLLERADTEARYEQALDRLAERARLDAEREARDRARGVTVAPTAPDGSRLLFFVVERRGDRLAAHWNDGGERPPRAAVITERARGGDGMSKRRRIFDDVRLRVAAHGRAHARERDDDIARDLYERFHRSTRKHGVIDAREGMQTRHERVRRQAPQSSVRRRPRRSP